MRAPAGTQVATGTAAGAATVRPIRAADRAAWTRLWEGYLDFYGVELSPAVTDTLWRRMMEPEPAVLGRVACLGDDVPVGIVHLVPHKNTWSVRDICYLEDLYVVPEQRGSGIGRALLEAALAEAKARNWARVYWMTQRDNATARKLYDRYAMVDDFVRYTVRLAQG